MPESHATSRTIIMDPFGVFMGKGSDIAIHIRNVQSEHLDTDPEVAAVE